MPELTDPRRRSSPCSWRSEGPAAEPAADAGDNLSGDSVGTHLVSISEYYQYEYKCQAGREKYRVLIFAVIGSRLGSVN